MKIKDTLDLCGWGLHNFCIQNHDDLETLQNLGLGRKIFYTGNSNDKHHREVIYDGSTWRVSAYMSDVDELRGLITALENATDEEIESLKGRATTTEGNLATLRSEFDALNKALNDDTAGVIDTWSEVVDFVNEYNGSQDLSTILAGMNTKIDGKLDLTGGTIRNSGAYLLEIDRTDGKPAILFSHNGSPLGYLGYDTEGNPIAHVNSVSNILLHAGNYADYALPLAGGNLNVNASIGIRAYFASSDGTAWAINGITFKNRDLNKEFAYLGAHGTGESYYYTYIGSNGYDGLNLRISKTYLRWGVNNILHEGNYSDLITTLNGNLSVGGKVLIGVTEDNGAKLQVNGSVTLVQDSKIAFVSDKGTLYGVLEQGSSGNVLIGQGSAKLGCDSYVYGKNLYLGYGTTPTIGMILNSSGNVLIGTPTPLNETSKLQIKGDLYVEGNIIATKEVSAGGAATEGNGGAGGFSLYESWGTSAPTEPLALGANLGYELKTRVEDLELAKTKVTFEPALVSGKQIGTIEIDGNKTNLFAPATYAWSEIDGRPTSLSQFTDDVVSGKYLLLSGGTMTGSIDFVSGNAIKSNSQNVLVMYAGVDTYLYGSNSIYLSTPNLYHYTDSGVYKVLDAGNVGEYALKKVANVSSLNNINAGEFFYSSYKPTSIPQGNYVGGVTLQTFLDAVNDYRVQLAFSTDATGFVRRYTNGTWSYWKTIAFTDNVLLLDGSNAMKAGVKFDSFNIDLNVGLKDGIRIIERSASHGPTTSTYWNTLSVSGNAGGFQIAVWPTTDNTILYYRKQTNNGTWHDWKTIAFTDSDITGTAAKAKSLVDTAGNAVAYVSGNTFYIGDSIYPTTSTQILGKDIRLRYGANASFGFWLNESGNVTIGDQDYAGSDYRLHVKGDLHVTGNIIADGEVSAGGAGTEGGTSGGGTSTNPYVVNFTPSTETSYTFYHNLPYYDVVVQVYEKNAISGAWDMILADVTIANESRLVTVDFGRKENVEHKIVVR